MVNFICHSCGSSDIPDGSSPFVKCEYCGAAISVAKFFEENSTDTLKSISDAGISEAEIKTISRLFEDAEHQIKVKEYASARGNFEEILKIYPRHIPSRLNLANCLLFDTEKDPLDRGRRVRDHLVNANEDYQEIPEIVELKKSIAFNIASMGANITDGMKSIDLFKISKEVAPDNKETDELIKTFYQKLSPTLISRIQKGLKKSKNSFSPTVTDLTIMIEGSGYDPSIRTLSTQMHQHMAKNKNKIHQRSLSLLEDLGAVCDPFVHAPKKGLKTPVIIASVITILIFLVYVASQ